jgi:hypothetical protein
VKADGGDQKVAGHAYFDTLAVKVIDDRNVEFTTKKDGKTMAESKNLCLPMATC